MNDYDENSNAPLHLAALEGHTKVAAVLIEAGADIAARFDCGYLTSKVKASCFVSSDFHSSQIF